MHCRLRRWEFAALAGAVIVMLSGIYLDTEQAELAERVIRLHVIANSDSSEDQALKLKVRDRILEAAKDLYRPEDNVQTARQRMEENLHMLAGVGQAVVEEEGYGHCVSASLERTWFPTKQYTDFALPAGNYTALRIVIGDGNGRNWWCVVFPPLCLGSVSETVDEAAATGSFTKGQVSLITGETQGYVVKFKAMELWEEWKRRIS